MEHIGIGLIGAGNMGGAIFKALKSKGYTGLVAYDLDVKKVCDLGVEFCETLEELFLKAKYVIVAVKPQGIDDFLKTLPLGIIRKMDTILISIVTGVSTRYFKKNTYSSLKVVAVMPNTPLLLGVGTTAVALPPEEVTDDEFDIVKSIFESCGKVYCLPEDKIYQSISLSGSSPAFLYYMCQLFSEYGISEGIDPDTSIQLFAHTMLGAAKMLLESGMSPDQLINMVTSPGGTTLAGLESLRDNDLSGIVAQCCKACTKRAHENGKDV